MRINRIVFVVLGSVCLALGTIGIALPVLPTVPFYLLTVLCYAKGSKRLHDRFISSSLYKKHLESFANKKGMAPRTKMSIIMSVTVLMTVGFILMKKVPVARIVLVIVWAAHVICFVFFVKNYNPEADDEKESSESEEKHTIK